MSGLLVAFVLVCTVGGGLLLYALVRREHGQRRAMDRATAERVARRDTDEGSARERASDDRDRGNHWDGSRERSDGSRWDDRR